MYTMPRCVQCNATTRWFDKRGLVEGRDYQKIDVSHPDHEQDLLAIRALGYSSAPVVIVNLGDTQDEKHWYGFRDDLLTEFCTPEAAA